MRYTLIDFLKTALVTSRTRDLLIYLSKYKLSYSLFNKIISPKVVLPHLCNVQHTGVLVLITNTPSLKNYDEGYLSSRSGISYHIKDLPWGINLFMQINIYRNAL